MTMAGGKVAASLVGRNSSLTNEAGALFVAPASGMDAGVPPVASQDAAPAAVASVVSPSGDFREARNAASAPPSSAPGSPDSSDAAAPQRASVDSPAATSAGQPQGDAPEGGGIPAGVAAVEATGFVKRYGKVEAVRGLDLRVRQGELFGLIGPDGAGKSSLLKAAAGVLSYEGGEVRVFGLPVTSEAGAEAAKARLGFMPQGLGRNLYGDLSIEENIDFFAKLRLVPPDALRERKERLLAMTRLDRFRARPMKQLSGGMKQKLGLVCTLIHGPRLILLDEPTTGVDPVSRRDFWTILHEILAEGGVTAVISTAYMDEASRFDRVALLHLGRALAVGPARAVTAATPGVALRIRPQLRPPEAIRPEEHSPAAIRPEEHSPAAIRPECVPPDSPSAPDPLELLGAHYASVRGLGDEVRVFVPAAAGRAAPASPADAASTATSPGPQPSPASSPIAAEAMPAAPAVATGTPAAPASSLTERDAAAAAGMPASPSPADAAAATTAGPISSTDVTVQVAAEAAAEAELRALLVPAGLDFVVTGREEPDLEDVFVCRVDARGAGGDVADASANRPAAGETVDLGGWERPADVAPPARPADSSDSTNSADAAGPEADASRLAISARGLVRDFGAFRAVDHVSFSVRPGEIFGLLGANGAGKTTVIKMLTGILPPTGGAGSVAGADMLRGGRIIKERIGYMSQAFSLYSDLTVLENLRLYAGVYGLPRALAAERVAWAVRLSGLSGREGAQAGSLPMGLSQRLALSCALLHRPRILFLDEPTSGVDPLGRRLFWDILRHLSRRAGVAVLITTHYMSEAEYCDHLALMYAGRVVADATPAAMKRRLLDEAGPMLEVRADDPHRAVAVLAAAGFAGAALHGGSVHVQAGPGDAAERGRAVLAALASAGVAASSATQTRLSMEDVFVHRVLALEAADRAADGAGASPRTGKGAAA